MKKIRNQSPLACTAWLTFNLLVWTTVAGLAISMLQPPWLAAAPPASEATVDPHIPEYKPAPGLSGHLNAVGADTMETLMKYWIEGFAREEPGVSIHFGSKVSGAAAPALIAGSAQLGPVAREMLPAELLEFKNKFGYEPLAVAVAGGSYKTRGKTHAIAFFVNKANPITKLTFAQIDAMYSTTRRRQYPESITRWGQLGLEGKWADAPIHLYGVRRPNGIANFIRLRVLEGGEYKNDIKGYTTVGSLPALRAITLAVGHDPCSIGYAGLQCINPDVKALAVAESPDDPYIHDTFQNVLTHQYPLSRVIYIYVNKPPHQAVAPAIRGFLEFVLSRQGQQAVVKEGIFLPLPYRIVVRERRELQP